MKTLNDARKINNITQAQLAQLLKVSQVSVSNWERGACLPNQEYRERMETVLSEEILWNLDAPYSEQERIAVMSMCEEIFTRTADFQQTLTFALSKGRREMRSLIRSMGYLIDPMLLPRDVDNEKSVLKRRK